MDSLILERSMLTGVATPMPNFVALRVASGPVIRSMCRGWVRDAGTFENRGERVEEPVPGGLFDEASFGPSPRREDGTIDEMAYRRPLTSRPQLRDFGAAILPSAILHPFARRLFAGAIAQRCSITRSSFDDLLEGRVVLEGDALVPVHQPEEDADVEVGVRALEALAKHAGHSLPWIFDRVPVLPAGLRGPSRDANGELTYRLSTEGYVDFLFALMRERNRDSGSLIEAAEAQADLQALVEAFYFDGFDREGHPLPRQATAAQGETPGYVQTLPAPFLEECFGDLDGARGADEVLHVLRGDLYIAHAYLQAFGLEVVPRSGDGSLDEDARSKWHSDRIVNAVEDGFQDLYAAPWAGLLASAPEEERPHVHTLSFDRDGRASLVVTAGLSAGPLYRDSLLCIELACEVPRDLPEALRRAMLTSLLELARERACLRPRSTSAPIAPGSELTHWYAFLDIELSAIGATHLPGGPMIGRAMGLSDAELALLETHGEDALEELLTEAGDWPRTDPRRPSRA